VDKSDFCPSGLTVPSAPHYYQKALHVSRFKQRGSLWPFRLSCFCSCSSSSLDWRCFVALLGLIFSLLMHKQAGDVLWSTVCSSPALHLIAPSVVSPRQAWNQPLHLCAPGARSKAGGEPPSAYPPQASLDPTSSARTSATDRPPSSPG
jgi:hypothetical protein